jgi:hypothetical protein
LSIPRTFSGAANCCDRQFPIQLISKCWLAHSKTEFKEDDSVDCQICFYRQIQTTVPEQNAEGFGQLLIVKNHFKCQAANNDFQLIVV